MQYSRAVAEHISTDTLSYTRIAIVRFDDRPENIYEVLNEDADGTLELRPEAPAAASLRRLGLLPATLEEIEAEYGPMLPPDDEP